MLHYKIKKPKYFVVHKCETIGIKEKHLVFIIFDKSLIAVVKNMQHFVRKGQLVVGFKL